MGLFESIFGKKVAIIQIGQESGTPNRLRIDTNFSNRDICGPFELYCGDNINFGVPEDVFFGLEDSNDLSSLSGTLTFQTKKIRTCEGQWYLHYNYKGTRYRNKIYLWGIESSKGWAGSAMHFSPYPKILPPHKINYSDVDPEVLEQNKRNWEREEKSRLEAEMRKKEEKQRKNAESGVNTNQDDIKNAGL
jgi:hypothetical protein